MSAPIRTSSSVRITAKCTSCARKFLARDGVTGSILAEDVTGALTCPACECDYCGHGHATSAQIAECDQERAEAREDRALAWAC